MSTPQNKNFLSTVCLMQQWMLGPYIARLIEEKGGRQAGWPHSRVAKEAGISASYLKWIIDGSKSDKLNPPEISLDVIIRLSKALNVPVMNLVAAYQGKDPHTMNDLSSNSNYKALIMDLLLKLPADEVMELALLKAGNDKKALESLKREIENKSSY